MWLQEKPALLGNVQVLLTQTGTNGGAPPLASQPGFLTTQVDPNCRAPQSIWWGGGGLQSPNLGSPVQHGEDADETPQQRHKIVQLPLAVSIAFLSLRTHLHEPSSFTVTPAHQELSVPPSGSSLPWPGSQLWMSQAKIKGTARLASHGGLRGKLHSQAHSRGQNYIAS